MAKKAVKKPKLVKDNPVKGEVVDVPGLVLQLTEITSSQEIEIIKLNARIDRIVAAASKAKPITKDM